MDKGVIFDKHVGPNKQAGWNFSKSRTNVQLGNVSDFPSKITIRNKKLELKVENLQFRIN